MPATRVVQPEHIWRSAIVGATDDLLEALLLARPDVLEASPRNLDELASVVLSPHATLQTYILLNRGEQEALQAACVFSGPVTVAELAGVLGVKPDELMPLLDGLATRGLVLLPPALAPGTPTEDGDSTSVLVNPGLRPSLRFPAGLGPPLGALLMKQQAAKLTEISRRLGLPPRPTKVELIESIHQHLSDPAIVRDLVLAGPDGTVALAERLAVWPEHTVTGVYNLYQVRESDRNPVGYLLRRGLVAEGNWLTVTVPAEVGVALRGGRMFPNFTVCPPDLETEPVDVASSESDARDAAHRLTKDVAAILDLWGAAPAKLLANGGLGVREVRRLAKATGRSERDAARLAELTEATGLARVNFEDRLVLPTVAFDNWLKMSTAARWAQVAVKWLETSTVFGYVGCLDIDDKPVPPLSVEHDDMFAAAQRELLLRYLDEVPEGRAPVPASLARLADWEAPSVWRNPNATARVIVGWTLEEAAWLGVVSGGRLTSFGEHLADGDVDAAIESLEALSPPVAEGFVLQADLTAVVAGELSPPVRDELDLIADVESAGGATVYRFVETSLWRGFDAGQTAGEILGFLETHAVKGVPQALSYLVEDVARRHGRLRVSGAVSYVRSEDASLIAELAAAKRLRRLALRSIAPTVAVSDVMPAVLVAGLRDAGYLAASEAIDGTLVVTRPRSGQARMAARVPADEWPPPGNQAERVPATAVDEAAEPARLGEFVGRLRENTSLSSVPNASPKAGKSDPQRSFGLRDDDDLDWHDDEPKRPTSIVRQRDEISVLLEAALTWDWPIRLAYEAAHGRDREVYARAQGYDTRAVRLQEAQGEERYGPIEVLERDLIVWVRIATLAEEVVQGL